MSVDKAAPLGRSPLHAPCYWDEATKAGQVGLKVASRQRGGSRCDAGDDGRDLQEEGDTRP